MSRVKLHCLKHFFGYCLQVAKEMYLSRLLGNISKMQFRIKKNYHTSLYSGKLVFIDLMSSTFLQTAHDNSIAYMCLSIALSKKQEDKPPSYVCC